MNQYLTIQTTRGTITAELFGRDCPATVERFVQLANAGAYDGARLRDAREGRRTITTSDPVAVGAGTVPCERIGNRNRHVIGALSLSSIGDASRLDEFSVVLDESEGRSRDGIDTVFGLTTDGIDVARALSTSDRVLQVRVRE